MFRKMFRAALGVALGMTLLATSGVAAAHPAERSYTVTFENLTTGQPFSPIVAATHQNAIGMFGVGDLASAGLEAIAEDGDNSLMFTRFDTNKHATSAVDVGLPLTTAGNSVTLPNGIVVTDTVSFEITAKPGDRFSLATMLICTNDGFTGLDAVKLPKNGSATFYLAGYDAGTEDNTELSADIVDPCSLLGPAPLAGDPNGNEDAAVDTDPAMAIAHHGGIVGGGDLDPSLHNWSGPVAKVTISRN